MKKYFHIEIAIEIDEQTAIKNLPAFKERIRGHILYHLKPDSWEIDMNYSAKDVAVEEIDKPILLPED